MTVRSISSAKALALLILSGCASQTARDFTPYTVEIKNKAAFSDDLSKCREYALDYLQGKSSINPSETAREGFRAGLGNLGYSILSPTAPALGALGGASSEAVSELGLNSLEAKKIIASCMQQKGQNSGNYLTIDPFQ